MAALTSQNVVLTGLVNATYAAADVGGDTFSNDGARTILHVKNGDASPKTVTVDDIVSQTPTGAVAFNPDVQVTIPAGQDAFIGPLPVSRFGRTVTVNYDAVTSVTVAVLYLA